MINVWMNILIHEYKDTECFLKYNERKDSYRHLNGAKAYGCVYEEVEKIKSEKFEQPPHRDDF